MNYLRELLGRIVEVEFQTDEDFIYAKGEIINVSINDYYFEDKNEPILIELNLSPIDMPEGLDVEDFINVPLSSVRRAD